MFIMFILFANLRHYEKFPQQENPFSSNLFSDNFLAFLIMIKQWSKESPQKTTQKLKVSHTGEFFQHISKLSLPPISQSQMEA